MGDVSSPAGRLDRTTRRGVVEHGSRTLASLRAGPLAPAILAAAGTALVLGLVRLGTPSFWVDESFTARAVDDLLLTPWNQYHWLYYWIETPWAALAGTSEWALRLPSVLGAMLACALVVVLADRLFDRPVALVSGLFLATNVLVVQWSQQARGYTLLLALSLLATLLLLRALDRGSRGAWAVYGVAYTLVVLWHPVGGVLLAPAHLALAGQRRERVFPHGLLAGVIVLAVAVPWAAQTAIRSTGEGVAMNWLKAPTAGEALRGLLDVSGALGLGVLLALLGLGVLARARRADPAVWLGVWAFAPFAVALLVSTFRPIFLDRYLIVAAPAFAILAAVAVLGVGSRWRIAVVLAVAVATAIGLVRWYGKADEGNWHGEDWRSAVHTVLERRGEADAIVVAPWSAAPAARYYGADVVDVSTADRVWVLVWSEGKPHDFDSDERAALGFGDLRRVEKLPFGRRLSAQLWRRP